jgi:NAD(P)-dependent dehydrogenase (short-subunit alcohol dehydrogenase family)
MTETSAVAIVTGAVGNLGRATAKLLASRGRHIVAVDRDAASLDAMIATLDQPERHIALAESDLADAAACDRILARALDRFWQVDGVVHTVGGFEAAPIAATGPEAWERMFRLNVITTANVFRAAIKEMRTRKSGSLVAIGAGAALHAPAGLSPYAAAKSAVLRLTESLADELKAEGIRVNAILPSTIDTPQNRAAMPAANYTAWVRPEELAAVIAFLLTDESSGVTGALIPVNGRA